MYDDPIAEEVRKIRERLAGKHYFDLGSIFEDLRKRQATLGKRLVRSQSKKFVEQAAVPDRNSATLHPGR
ncbi:MAG: hypothetical protein COW04_09540 [Deltaproteobacteria bacterium CG12_big_fil_rev_8_21_14_0_65_43_10]|nr:MAG: hypothetical protein AUK23_08025 [Deltaproteobacteria bacterium CG2_30_43_15]PIQ45085.1 MAG: hypothetical protein COW04_09540 [Deltaproteobacteria bacterium CG12_big_fil_rev_8_21_14_0_65_43_10]PIU86101.1 MAG: hypothetical protein COS67_04295 [Deltaproteobacteria bacterium CG06_land_8_20_14_3_00_44_19]PIX24723.1 MAG: hypothetical protein COZ68_05760 [Deltaproteobacteria bacterium CG_4_8_14_3_um_filter_43_13]PIZ19383.1 MAG: hypothetical protein COY50_10305 [Deltaproteobacteria bacterium C